MKSRLSPVRIPTSVVAAAVTAAATGALLSSLPTRATAQAPAYTAPRFVDGNPDLNGIWQALAPILLL